MSTYLFCGSREWTDVDAIRRRIDALEVGSTVIHGGARGADTIAGRLAKERGLRVDVYYPRWSELGRKAGIVRNREMLVEGKPVRVFAFIVGASPGTRNTVATAKKLGIPTVVCELPP